MVLNGFQHGDVTALFAMTVVSVAHVPARRILTGTPAATSPDMAAIAAAANGSEYPFYDYGPVRFHGPIRADWWLI